MNQKNDYKIPTEEGTEYTKLLSSIIECLNLLTQKKKQH